MPCVVPNCDPVGQSFTLRFPRNHLLFERWRQAIELGTGSTVPADINHPDAEICQQHFYDTDQYSEPHIFRNRRFNRIVHLSSCRLCLRFNFSERVAPDLRSQIIGNVAVEEIIKAIFEIDLGYSEYFDGICEDCLARLDIVVAIRKQFIDSENNWRMVENFISEENRLRYTKVLMTEIETNAATTFQVLSEEMIDMKNPLENDIMEIIETASIENESVKTEETIDMKNSLENDVMEIIETVSFENEPVKTEEIFENTDNCVWNTNDHEYSLSKTDMPVEPIAKNDERRKLKLKIDPTNIRRKVRGRPSTGRKNKVILKGMTDRKCYICVRLFKNPEELLSHIIVHVDQDLTCNVCHETCLNIAKYNRHLAKHDSVERPFKCDYCELRFANEVVQRFHETRNHGIDHPGVQIISKKRKDKYTCQHCGKQCDSLAFLKEHEGAHSGIKQYECKICGRLFANKNNLERHNLLHTSEMPYKCEICGKGFRQSPRYKDHLREHSGETPYACDDCGRQFSTTTLLRKHKVSFHCMYVPVTKVKKSIVKTSNTLRNNCPICPETFKQHSLLVDHIDLHHPDEDIKIFQCTICEKRFVSRQAYYVHFRNHEKRFQCEYCEKAFSSIQTLKFHHATHSGIRAYSCQTCSRSFAHLANLKRHELVHLGIKRHECDICGKRFVQSNQLHSHRRTHTGDKPYECKSCEKRFADISTLRKHRKNVCVE
ncbi:zinc finger protein ZFP2-like [Topomyia yanbarensis]|uniref:zinc finger protein ZFP2-like n=1 Tax=Topomyia yanbarensis TaxID=2498891 RepID=UPI00273C49A3|nr:zinc finger protein ZFP2-like [Topomyia yanbarensis]XP_058833674.1 zinc finger protein ZFP2-like [Topomyia yanbarensis]